MLTESSEMTTENAKAESVRQQLLVSAGEIAEGTTRQVSMKAFDEERWQAWVAKRQQDVQQRARREQIRSEVLFAVLAVASVTCWLLW